MFKSLRHLDETLTTANCNEDTSFVKVVESMTSDKSRIWNASGSSGTVSLPWWEKLSNELEPNLLVLSGTGVANILVFRNHASKHMKLFCNNEDDTDQAIDRLSKVITRESKELKRDQSTYET